MEPSGIKMVPGQGEGVRSVIQCHDCQTPNWSGAEVCRRCGAELYGQRKVVRSRRLGWIHSLLQGLTIW